MPDRPNNPPRRLPYFRPASWDEERPANWEVPRRFGLDQDFGLGDHVGREVLPTPPKKTIFNRRKLARLAKEVDFNVIDQDTKGRLEILVKPRDKDISVHFVGRRRKTLHGDIDFEINRAYARDASGESFIWKNVNNKALSRSQLKDTARQLKLNFPEITRITGERATGIHSRTQTTQFVRLNPKRLGLLPYQEGRAASSLSPALKALNKRRPLGIGARLIPIAAAGYFAGKLFSNHSETK